MAPAPDRATVIDPGKPGTPLPDIGTFEATPAFKAIQDGLGAYLKSQGYVAEHPLLYVNETEDPFVYVRFEISPDGLGFLDTTFIYSPGVARQLDEIFTAYGVYEDDEPQMPYTSEAQMLGRPVHASIQALQTREMEETIDRIFHWRGIAEDRPEKPFWERRRIVSAAKRRAKQRGTMIFPRFGHRFDEYNIAQDDGAPFRSLPLNWRDIGDVHFTNWAAEPHFDLAAKASVQTWKAYVAPRLVHASRDRGADTEIKTWLSASFSNQGGYGELGGEWRPLDRLYWSMKMSYHTDRYWEDWEYSVPFADAELNLYSEFRNIAGRIYRQTDVWLESHDIEIFPISDEDWILQAELVLIDSNMKDVAFLYTQQTAVAAFRDGVAPEPKWRQPNRQNPYGTYPPPKKVIVDQLKYRFSKSG